MTRQAGSSSATRCRNSSSDDKRHTGDLLDIVEHQNQARYPSQRILVVLISGYVDLVPYVEADDHLFLKTIIPSRKATIAYRPGDAP